MINLVLYFSSWISELWPQFKSTTKKWMQRAKVTKFASKSNPFQANLQKCSVVTLTKQTFVSARYFLSFSFYLRGYLTFIVIADKPSFYRRLQRLLPWRFAKVRLATHGRAKESLRNLIKLWSTHKSRERGFLHAIRTRVGWQLLFQKRNIHYLCIMYDLLFCVLNSLYIA